LGWNVRPGSLSLASRRRRRSVPQSALTAVALVGLAASALIAPPASAATVTAASFSGGAGTVTVGNALYTKNGGTLTLNVTTSSDTKCVQLSGAFTAGQTSSTAKSSWAFSLTAGSGDGVRAVTVAASPNFNGNGCTGQTGTTQASFTLDNTGPVVTSSLTPAANAAGWNNTGTTVTWTAIDAGSGVTAVQPFQTDTVSANGVVVKTAPAQSDRLGNTGVAGAVTVRVDKAAPSITAAQTQNPNGTTTVTFTCADAHSGITSCLADGSSTNSKTIQPGVTVTGTATDNAGNTSTASSTAPAGDTTPPTLSGSPTSPPNANGWHKDNVAIHWTCSDNAGGSGIAGTCPADSTISSEGQLLTDTKSVSDNAGNSTTATSSPAVNIDKTAPTTGISGTSNNWTNGQVTVTLTPSDNLSGPASTSYSVDGGATQTGTSFTLSSEGDHTVTYSSTDRAGNTEAAQTVHVKIDKTAPTIDHWFSPPSYLDGGWTNQDVTVTFTCADQGGSGLASCTAPVTKSTEGEGQQVTGTATDNAGNTATNTAVVSIDKTPPTVQADVDRAANGAGWYSADVIVSFTANDTLSGVAGKSADKVLGEGANQSASGFATDTARNSASDSVTGINVDKTKPVLSATFSQGWHSGDVIVDWSCTDTLSGPASQPADDTVTGEGANLSSTASCADRAGNTVTKTVSGIQIDRTAPSTTAEVLPAPASGWYTASVQVTLTGDDNLSGIAATYYSVDGGTTTEYVGAFFVAADGKHSITFWSKDVAGNLESAGAPLAFQIDKATPSTSVINPISPDSGWFVTSGIPFAFDASDEDSGIAATYYTIDGAAAQAYGEPFTADLSTGTHTVAYWSQDIAGNVEAAQSLVLKVDTIAPTITGSQSPAANGFGWNNTDVNVTFSCTDAGSGINGVAGCAGDTTLTNDGAGQTVHGDAVDVAGNRSRTDFGPVNIDTTKPTLTGVPSTDANGAGWYKGDVAIHWTGDDALSGIDPATQPAGSAITGEGETLSAGPVTIKDKAGNVSDPASVSGIKIDRTAPAVTGAPTTQPNAAGWYRDEVVVDFKCTDNLSGVAFCPTSKLIKGDGTNQGATSDPATDVAGNASAGKNVGGINIDGTAPTTTSNNQCTKVNGWCTGTTANVVLTAADQAGLSGVKEIHYRIDGGAEQVAAGATKTVSVPLDGSGAGTVSYWAVDNAGNVEPGNSVGLKWDNIAPTVTHTLSPLPNADDWNNNDVTVHFVAKDDDAGSGVAAGSVTTDVLVSGETSGLRVDGSATDTAGNVGTDSVTVKLDKTAPSVSGGISSGTRGNNGWYVGPVTVHFTCSDSLSGIATCPDDVVLSKNGANTASGTATDKAGNTATATVSGITIDQEKPTLTAADVNVAGVDYTLGSVPTATCTAKDDVSGVASCQVTVSGGNGNGVGTWTYTATATDKAGNTTTVTGTYTVAYRFDGFLQPINDTAHQVGTTTSIFRAGSTVPAKFQLKKADGTVIQAVTAPVWLNPVKGSATTAPVDESIYTASADSGSTYRYDTTAQQYIYNWKTGMGGNYWRIGVRLDDGQTYYVNIGLR